MAPLLEIRDLHTVVHRRRDTVRAVDGVSLSLNRGEVLGIVGESGCGKTMTALSVMRLLPPGAAISAGSIHLDGTDLTTADRREMAAIRGDRIGMVFQDPLSSLNPTMTIGNQIAEAYLLHREGGRSAARERAREVLDLVGIPDPRGRIDDYPHQFSGGMRQRVMIAMALACEPDLLIADEPTTALDVTTQREVLSLFDSLAERFGMAMVLVTHDLGVIAGRADRVAVMYAGRIVEQASTEAVYGTARHRYTQALFSAIPEAAGRDGTEALANIPGLPPDLSRPQHGCRFAARCGFVQPDCREQEPALAEVASGHWMACAHPVPVPRQVRVPREGPRTPAVPGIARQAVDVQQNGDPAMPVLQIRNLVKEFRIGSALRRRPRRVSAVADVSFSVLSQQTFGLVGESGCGKSTLGKTVVALENPTSGSVLLQGDDLFAMHRKELRARRRDLQLVYQDAGAALDPRMRVGSILAEPLRIQRIGSRREQERTVRRLLDDVGMPASAVERYAHEFSGGQRQRIALARALALRPKVIVADEPVSALDVSVQAQILNLLADLQAEHRLGYVLISHDLAVVRHLADRIGVMYLGKLVEIGDRDSIFTRTLHPYTRALIEAVPVPDPALERVKPAPGVRGDLPSAVNPPSGCRFRTRCPIAQELCATSEPPLVARPNGQAVACHFPLRAFADGS